MALKILQSGIQPIGQFDGYDNEVTLGAGGVKGGEVATLVSFVFSGTTAGVDLAAPDADGSDGYVGVAEKKRPIVTRNLPDGARPLFLTDDGSTGYGTLFGQLVGATVGQVVAGEVLGPHTAAGSGKITLWDKQGLYASTLDAVDTTASTGLVPDNATLDVGDPLYATATGLLTPNVALSFDTDDIVVARFVEFSDNGSKVTTPHNLASATGRNRFTQAVYFFNPEA
jgi:hypothetical protein